MLRGFDSVRLCSQEERQVHQDPSLFEPFWKGAKMKSARPAVRTVLIWRAGRVMTRTGIYVGSVDNIDAAGWGAGEVCRALGPGEIIIDSSIRARLVHGVDHLARRTHRKRCPHTFPMLYTLPTADQAQSTVLAEAGLGYMVVPYGKTQKITFRTQIGTSVSRHGPHVTKQQKFQPTSGHSSPVNNAP